MIASDTKALELSPYRAKGEPAMRRAKRRLRSGLLWFCLLLVCAGTSWFSFQYFLVPQTKHYAPNWYDSRWVQAPDNTGPIAYFRYNLNVNSIPDGAHITLAANQVFRLYVNGVLLGSNNLDFIRGEAPQTYIYDIDSLLLQGVNVIGIRVANVDQGIPQLRANIGATWGTETRNIGSNSTWQATGQPSLVHPRGELKKIIWSTNTFDATLWQPAQVLQQQPRSSFTTSNPKVYEQAMPSSWMSTYTGEEGYFVRKFTMPSNIQDAFLRLVATGKADVFINGHQYMTWDGQVPLQAKDVLDTLDDHEEEEPYRNGLLMGMYDVTPYVHPGENTIAIHVQSPGTSTAAVGLDTLKTALSVDMVVGANDKYSNPLAQMSLWHVSPKAVPAWEHASAATNNWEAPQAVGRPGASRAYFLPDATTPRNEQIIPAMQIALVIVFSTIAILATWLFMALIILRRYYSSNREALQASSLIFLPALAVEAILASLAREFLMPQPFPYTKFWGLVLIGMIIVSAIVLWFHARRQARQLINGSSIDTVVVDDAHEQETTVKHPQSRKQLALHWLKRHWGLVVIVAMVTPMVCYNLAYEPFWQDELSSYNAARNIMKQGFPAFPSGFIYPKGELFSYFLALFMLIFGHEGTTIPRIPSVITYLTSLPLLYITALKIFNRRRIAWLATAMLAFSPYTLIWARQTRMYEQAQFGVILVLLSFYIAIKCWEQKRPIYVAIACLVLAYLSHEENFIVLPSVLVCSLLFTRKGKYGLPVVLRQKHWWIAALIGIAIIAIQLSFVVGTHPTIFSSDQSRRPQIQITTDNLPYYFNLLFKPVELKNHTAPGILVAYYLVTNSIAVTISCIMALVQKDMRARYCATFLLTATATLFFLFTMQADRYYYPLLPVYFLVCAHGTWTVLDAVWKFAHPYLVVRNTQNNRTVLPAHMRWAATGAATLICASLLIIPILPLGNYNLFVSRAFGFTYRRHFADYDNVSQYMQQHLRKGDIVIAVSPAVSILYYVGQVDYYFSIDRSLFLFENNKKLMETTSGSHPMLNQDEFEKVLATNDRIWLITDNGSYQGGVVKNGRFEFPPADFRMVFEGYGSAIYFRSASK